MRKHISKAFSMVMVLVVTVVFCLSGTGNARAASKGSINLGEIHWNDDKTEYTFPDTEASFSSEQKLFCISVDNDGSFIIPGQMDGFDSVKSFTGVNVDGSFVENVSPNQELTSVTFIGSVSDSTIQSFIRGITFRRNGVSDRTRQNVTAMANDYVLPEDMGAVAVDGTIHYYRYVHYASDDADTWFDAYKAARASTFQGLHGYLATITSENEQEYIYNYFNMKNKTAGDSDYFKSWIGGLRTSTKYMKDSDWDGDSISRSMLYPAEAEQYPGANPGKYVADTWYWVDGPEAGKTFYITNSQGSLSGAPGSAAADINYNAWNEGEPNNNSAGDEFDKTGNNFRQEYALEYGYNSFNGKWNDYNPYLTTRSNVSGQSINGYLIEYSPYKNPESRGGRTEEETTPSTTTTRVVSLQDLIDLSSVTLSTDKPEVDQPISVVTVTDENGDTVDSANTVYQWQYRDDKGNWTDIHGANSDTYTPKASDPAAGHNIRVKVTAKDGTDYQGTVYGETKDGSVSDGSSDGVGPVAMEKNVLTSAELDKDALKLGDTVSVKTWTANDGQGAHTATADNATYQWQTKVGGEWCSIPDATDVTYTIPEGGRVNVIRPNGETSWGADLKAGGLRCAVTGKDSYTGTVYAGAKALSSTDPSEDNGAQIKDRTKEIVSVKVSSDEVKPGDKVSVTEILDKNNDKVDPGEASYQWQKKTGDTWYDIPGAIDSTYEPGDDDSDSEIRVVVTPNTRSEYGGKAESDPVKVGKAEPGKGGSTTEPGTTENSEKPGTSENPATSEEPSTSEDSKGGSTAVPATTEKTGTSEKPGTSENPATSEEPSTSEDNNDGSATEPGASESTTEKPSNPATSEDNSGEDKGGNTPGTTTGEEQPGDSKGGNTPGTTTGEDQPGDSKGGNTPGTTTGEDQPGDSKGSSTTDPSKNQDTPETTEKEITSVEIKTDSDNPGAGDTVKVDNIKAGDDVVSNDDVTYQWQKKTSDGSWEDISDATDSTYKITNSDTGTNLRVVITPKPGRGYKVTETLSTPVTVGQKVTPATTSDGDSDDGGAINGRGTGRDFASGGSGNGAGSQDSSTTTEAGTSQDADQTTGAAAGSGAAGSTSFDENTATVDSVEKDIPTITMSKKVGKGKKFRLTLLHTKGAAIEYASSNRKVATINKKGVIKGKKLGKTTVVLNVINGNYKVQYKVKVKVVKKLNNLNLKKYKTSYKHPSIALYKKLYVNGSYKVRWKHINNTKITYKMTSGRKYAKVNKKGKVTGLKPGISKMEITAKRSDGSISKYYVLFRTVKKGTKEKKYSFLRYN